MKLSTASQRYWPKIKRVLLIMGAFFFAIVIAGLTVSGSIAAGLFFIAGQEAHDPLVTRKFQVVTLVVCQLATGAFVAWSLRKKGVEAVTLIRNFIIGSTALYLLFQGSVGYYVFLVLLTAFVVGRGCLIRNRG